MKIKDPYAFIRVEIKDFVIIILAFLSVGFGIYSYVMSGVAKDQAEVIRGYEMENIK